MRVINEYDSIPLEKEIKVVGKTANCYIRQNIESHIVVDEEGNERTVWTATEWSTQLPYNSEFELTNELCEKIITHETDLEAERVREYRDELLVESDFQMLADRVASMTPEKVQEWIDYRQLLRDIPTQEGFPFDVVYPVKP